MESVRFAILAEAAMAFERLAKQDYAGAASHFRMADIWAAIAEGAGMNLLEDGNGRG